MDQPRWSGKGGSEALQAATKWAMISIFSLTGYPSPVNTKARSQKEVKGPSGNPLALFSDPQLRKTEKLEDRRAQPGAPLGS